MNTAKVELPHAPSKSQNNEWDHWMDWDPPPSTDQASTGRDLQSPLLELDDPPKTTPSVDEDDTCPPSAKKRKISSESIDSATRPGSRLTSVHNKSHSIVEKRYRTNLNEKISDLRNSIPSLRGNTLSATQADSLSATPRHNKSTILTKAIEYIHHLEQRNAYLENVNASLRSRSRSTKSELIHRREAVRTELSMSPNIGSGDLPPTTEDPPVTSRAAQGMIPVPDDIRELRNNAPQEHYADQNSPETQQAGSYFSTRGGKYAGKLTLGTLAGLMVMDGFVGNHKDRENDRGLFALPFSTSLQPLPSFWALQGRLQSFPYAFFLLPMVKGFLIFSILGFILFLYLFNSKPKLGLKNTNEGKSGSRSSASPMEVRENAWLTAIQTLKVPRHSWFPEMMALVLETGAYIVRQLLGWVIYSWLMGRSEDEEIARVRAWEIAIDAQLTGGDAEVSRSRLVLTLWAAGTLPKTPARLMLKALHLRIMFWKASRWPSICWTLNLAASQLAQYQWTLAKRMLDTVDVTSEIANFEPLSNHLLALLQRPAEEVMTDLTIQQAHNLCWNGSASTKSETVGVDDSAEDTAMRGPLDTLALWSSSLILQEALTDFLDSGEISHAHISNIEIAFRTAPPGSSSSIRALAAKTIVSEGDRPQNMKKLAVIFPGPNPNPFSIAVYNVILTSIEIAKALGTLADAQSDSVCFDSAVECLDRTCSRVKSLDILALAAVYNLLLVLIKISAITGQCPFRLHEIIQDTLVHLNKANDEYPAHAQDMFKTGLRKLQVKRRSSHASVESGYVSM